MFRGRSPLWNLFLWRSLEKGYPRFLTPSCVKLRLERLPRQDKKDGAPHKTGTQECLLNIWNPLFGEENV